MNIRGIEIRKRRVLLIAIAHFVIMAVASVLLFGLVMGAGFSDDRAFRAEAFVALGLYTLLDFPLPLLSLIPYWLGTPDIVTVSFIWLLQILTSLAWGLLICYFIGRFSRNKEKTSVS